MSEVKPSTAPVQRVALNVQEACSALGVSWDTWREHIEPEIKLVRMGRRKLVPVSALQAWLDEHGEAVR